MLLRAAATSAVWQPVEEHVNSATRKSPGLMKRTNSRLSAASRALVRSGVALEYLPSLPAQRSGYFGATWAALITLSNSASPRRREASSSLGNGLPPWQAVQVKLIRSVPSSLSLPLRVLCIGSLPAWQLRQPSTLCASGEGEGAGVGG